MAKSIKARACMWKGAHAVLAALAVFALALGIALVAPVPAQAETTGHTVTLVTYDPDLGGSSTHKFPDGLYQKSITGIVDGSTLQFDSDVFLDPNDGYVPRDTGYYNDQFLCWVKIDKNAKSASIWYSDTPVTEDVVLFAVFAENSEDHFVKFVCPIEGNADTVVAGKSVDDGKLVNNPADPVRQGYTFKGWYQDRACTKAFDFAATKITDDTTVYAKFEKNTYTVTFDANGGFVDTDMDYEYGPDGTRLEIAKIPVTYGSVVDTSAFGVHRHGYDLVSWCTDKEGTKEFDLSNPITSDMTLYAKWETATLTVTFMDTLQQLKTEAKVLFGDKVQQPADPVWQGEGTKIFLGWYQTSKWRNEEGWYLPSSKKFNFDTIIHINTIVCANWADAATVTFDTKGGTPSTIESQIVEIDGKVTKPEDPTKEGDGFYAWFTEDGKKWDFDNDTVKGDMTLHAEWVEGGNDDSDQSDKKDESKGNGAEKSGSKKALPQTGDNALVAICVAGAAGIAAVAVGIAVRRRKE